MYAPMYSETTKYMHLNDGLKIYIRQIFVPI